MSPFKLPKNCQCPPRLAKDKNDAKDFSIRQKYPYKLKKKKKKEKKNKNKNKI
jgi:hypothetical protein